MRTNLPITQQEHQFPDGETLLSTTDTSSHIGYANAAFVRTSGFDAEELVGQPHNLVRHPDMPSEAFADMWGSLKSGNSWTALVKNRRRNGDHYWVRANAAPMRRNGQVTGYLSVRTKPTRAEVQAAEQLYQRFRLGQARGLAFHMGLVVRTGAMRWLSALQLLPTVWRIRLPVLAMAGLLATVLAGPAMWGSLALALAGLLLLNLFLEQQIAAPLHRIARSAQQVASGEVSSEPSLDRCDDIGMIARAIQQSGLNLHSLVSDVYEQVSGVQVASREIAAANLELSSRTEQTASNLEQTAAAMEQQTATIHQNAETAQQASALAKSATQAAAQGGESVGRVVSTMEGISQASRKIANIISVIDGIAFQTNILALNAAVEAARAGEQGRGFAVVASEVRSLAGRSAAAAKEIKTLIDDSVGRVESGSSLVQQAGSAMTHLVAQVHQVSDLITEITEASREQALGVAQVSQAVAQLDVMTQQNAAMVEESSAAASRMDELAQRLVEAVRVFSH